MRLLRRPQKSRLLRPATKAMSAEIAAGEFRPID
jgi:hypothetical protein